MIKVLQEVMEQLEGIEQALAATYIDIVAEWESGVRDAFAMMDALEWFHVSGLIDIEPCGSGITIRRTE